MRAPRWMVVCLVVTPVGVVLGVLMIVLIDARIALIGGMVLSLSSFNVGVIALGRFDRLTQSRRSEIDGS